nr:MAG TPA: hypothetical protein [Caudoviricetes sp.]
MIKYYYYKPLNLDLDNSFLTLLRSLAVPLLSFLIFSF